MYLCVIKLKFDLTVKVYWLSEFTTISVFFFFFLVLNKLYLLFIKYYKHIKIDIFIKVQYFYIIWDLNRIF